MPDYKNVSIIIPVYNEEHTIIDCITSLLDGVYPLDNLEFVIADGRSTDNTLQIITTFSINHPNIHIKVVDNPNKTQGYGLNVAIENINEKCDIVLRADAHSVYSRNYVKLCVDIIQESGADNVGGVMLPMGKNSIQRAVAFCMSNALGVGNARFHLGNFSGFVDTVYLGCFKRDIFDKVGRFDPLMTPNEDAELNLRICKAGGRNYLNSNIRVGYYPRQNIAKLAKQYFCYGQGRCRTFKKHKVFTSVRQLVPPLWVIFTFIAISLSLLSVFFIMPLLVYLFILILVSAYGAIKNHDGAILLSPVCFIAMHYAWGLGFLYQYLHRS